MRNISQFIFKNISVAIILALASSVLHVLGHPMLGLLGMFIIATMTLTRGVKLGGLIFAVCLMPLCIAPFLSAQYTFQWQQLVSMVLLYLSAGALYYGVSWMQLLEYLTLIGLLTVAALHLLFPEFNQWFVSNYQASMALLNNQLEHKLTAAQMSQSVAQVGLLAEGLISLSFMLSTFFYTFISNIWSDSVNAKNTIGSVLLNLKLNKLFVVLFGLVAVSALLFKLPILYNLGLVLALSFLICGISVIHFGLQNIKWSLLWLVLMYLLLIFFPIAGFAVILLSVLDVMVDFRKVLSEK